ncbi:MAG: transporter substrate-binding domain-containing protein [Saccharospirillaceae bacterium]|nr:transporter substrate-binding domain-containing protein [Pseudomonadales bacterium]NRB80059.1 transporter substrate-binding domain-containing protein [Saccharospirillaceae bacterium]
MKNSNILKYLINVFLVFMLTNVANAQEVKWSFISDPFPPFADPGIKGKGVFWEITEAALKTQGIEATLTFAPFKRALEDSKAGKYDGLILAVLNKEREQWFLFSSYVFVQKTVFFKLAKRDDLNFDGNLKSLEKRNFSIAVLRGASMTEVFDNADYLNKIFVTHTQQAFQMLVLGRVDLVVSGLLNGKAILGDLSEKENKNFGELIDVLQPSLNDDYYHIAFSKKTPNYEMKVKIFNQGLMQIKENGTFKAILVKNGID